MDKAVKLKLKKAARKLFLGSRDPLEERAGLKSLLISRKCPDGLVAIMVWQRDCDLAEGTSLRYIPAHVMAFEKLRFTCMEEAEGPFQLFVFTPEEALEFTPSFRDRAAEQMNY